MPHLRYKRQATKLLRCQVAEHLGEYLFGKEERVRSALARRRRLGQHFGHRTDDL